MKRDGRRQEGEAHRSPAKRTQDEALATPDFIKVEKNLTSLGFFTPSSKRIKSEKAKTITFTRIVDGNRVEAQVTIAPAALYGLPVTADQDKFLALHKIITDIQQQEGSVSNPITFTSTELLKLLSQGDAGKNYQDVSEWLDVMTSTTIISEGAVYLAGKKVFAKDRFHVFDRAVSAGKELEPGIVADKNYVWLSSWQLENINNKYLLPIDFDAYKQLKNHIAKALVPLLQIWLYASRDEGSFEKRYDELCQILAIREYRHLSEIKRNFAPSLDELKGHDYLADWKIERTTDKKAYKIIFYHGEKFHRDRHLRLGHKTHSGDSPKAKQRQPEKGSETAVDHPLLTELTNRGILPDAARRLLATLSSDQPILDQLEWGDHLITQRESGSFRNPPGFYLYLLRGNVTVPADFETSRKKKLREEANAASSRAFLERLELEQAYDDYIAREIDQEIAAVGEVKYQEIIETKKQEFLKQYRHASTWDSDHLNHIARSAAHRVIRERIALLTFDVFCEQERQHRARAIVPVEPGSQALAITTDDQAITLTV